MEYQTMVKNTAVIRNSQNISMKNGSTEYLVTYAIYNMCLCFITAHTYKWDIHDTFMVFRIHSNDCDRVMALLQIMTYLLTNRY